MADVTNAGMNKYIIPEECKQTILGIFQRYDRDNNGVIDAGELENCLQVTGFHPTKEDVEFLLQYLDANGDGKLQIGELIENLDIINAHSVHGDELMSAFKRFDMNGDGYIKCTELISILSCPASRDKMSVREAKTLVDDLSKRYDKDGDGRFSYSEFVEMIISNGIPQVQLTS